MTKWATIVLSVVGLAVAVYVVATHGKDQPPDPPPAAPPSVNPYGRGIAATGQIEAASRNVAVATPEAGLVTAVLVQVGDKVTKGQPLMMMDTRLLEADRLRTNAAIEVSRARMARLRALPRQEELPPLQTAVDRALIRFNDAKDYYEDLSRAGAREAASRLEIDRRRFLRDAAEADYKQAVAQLDLLKAGTWQRDLVVAEAELTAAEAELRALELRLERLTVRSPIEGTVLKRNVEPGQFAMTSGQAAALVVGDLSSLHVRARVDEEDAPQLRDGAAATLRVRGIVAETVKLTMLRIEPLAQPKTDLINSPTERVDTRVVEVVFTLAEPAKSRLFPGQVVDVFIDAGAGKEACN